mgnify:CR=1 FL=1
MRKVTFADRVVCQVFDSILLESLTSRFFMKKLSLTYINYCIIRLYCLLLTSEFLIVFSMPRKFYFRTLENQNFSTRDRNFGRNLIKNR